MGASALTIIRLVPCGVYMVAAISLLSVAHVCNFPSSPLAWAVYTTMLPMTRRLVLALIPASDLAFWGAVVMFLFATVLGAYLAVRPQRVLHLRFVHSHAALIASGFAVIQASQNSAGLANAPLSQIPLVGWLFVSGPSAALALFFLTFLACLSTHSEFIKRIRFAQQS